MNSEIEQLLSRLQILLPEGSKACIETHNQEKTRYDSAATSKKSDSQIADQQCHKRDSHEWTTSDDWLLRLAWGTVNIDSIASMLDRQVSEVQSRIEDYRSRLVTEPWQPEELRLLAKLYGSRANIDLEITLMRSQTQIAAAAKRMRLKKRPDSAADRNVSLNLRGGKQNNRSQQTKPRRSKRSTRSAQMPRWTEAEVQRLITLYGNHDNLSISRELGRSITSIANKAWQLGISKSVEQLAKIGRSNVNQRHSSNQASSSNQGTNRASTTPAKETKPSPPKP